MSRLTRYLWSRVILLMAFVIGAQLDGWNGAWIAALTTIATGYVLDFALGIRVGWRRDDSHR